MRKYLSFFFIFVLLVYFFGCGQKKKEEEFLTMDELGAISLEPVTASDFKSDEATGPIVQDIPPPPPPPITPPPTGKNRCGKTRSKEIQTALKNAGYYMGAIDGKIGRLSKKAIEDFQEANGLKVDGKVGPKTWSVLSKYLTMQSPQIKKRR
jgi:hypothetical protein